MTSVVKKSYYNQAISSLCLSGTSLDEYDITIFDNIILALGHDLALRLNSGFITLFLQYVVVVHDTLDKGLLEVAVNNTSGLRSLGASTDSPLTDLIRTGCEETAELEGLAHGGNGLGKRGLGVEVLQLLGSLFVGHDSKTLLELDGDGDDRVARGICLDPFSDLGQMLVLLADVVLLTQVDEVDNRLR
jgi:hypothetical protein